jgi:arylsulfatase B
MFSLKYNLVMSYRYSLYVLFVFSLLVACSSRDDGKLYTEKPNIIIIVADDLGWNDVGYHNPSIKTPHIDKLSMSGMKLQHFYVNCVCSPTRAGLLTGRYPIRFGMQQGVCQPTLTHGLPPEEETVAELLGRAGYQSRACIGKWHLGHASDVFHPLNQGFTYFYGHYNGAIDYVTHKRYGTLDWHKNKESSYDKGYSTKLMGDEAVKFIHRASTIKSPFFLYLAFNAPHSPMQALSKDLKNYGFDSTKPLMPNPSVKRGKKENNPDYGDNGRGNTLRQTFSAMVSGMDREIGRVMNALQNKGISENTLVIFMSDNGGVSHYGGSNLPLKGGKFKLWQGGVRVPSIISWPGVIRRKRFNDVVGYIDIYPTLASIVGRSPMQSQKIDGINIFPSLLEGESPDSERFLYLGKDSALLQKSGTIWKLVNNDSFFDLRKDPNETNNIAKEHPSIVEKIRNYCRQVQSQAGEKYEVEVQQVKLFIPPHEWKTEIKTKD